MPRKKKLTNPVAVSYNLRQRKAVDYSLSRKKSLINPYALKIKREVMDDGYKDNSENIMDLRTDSIEIKKEPLEDCESSQVAVHSVDVEMKKELIEDCEMNSMGDDRESLVEGNEVSNHCTGINTSIKVPFGAFPVDSRAFDIMKKRLDEESTGNDEAVMDRFDYSTVKIKTEPPDKETAMVLDADMKNEIIVEIAVDDTVIDTDMQVIEKTFEVIDIEDDDAPDMKTENLTDEDALNMKTENLIDEDALNLKTENLTDEDEVMPTKKMIADEQNLSALNMAGEMKNSLANQQPSTSSAVNGTNAKTCKVKNLFFYKTKTKTPNTSTYNDVGPLDGLSAEQLKNPYYEYDDSDSMSEGEREQQQLEMDRRCEEVSRKTGQVWRRPPDGGPFCIHLPWDVPRLPDEITVFTPAGQKYIIRPNYGRPARFRCEEDRKMWDRATNINCSRLKEDIECGEYIPEGVDPQVEEQIRELREEAQRYLKLNLEDYYFSPEQRRIYNLESLILHWDMCVKTQLPENIENIKLMMNAIMYSPCLSAFMFVKHFTAFITLEKMMAQRRYLDLRQKAMTLYSKLQNMTDADGLEIERKAKRLYDIFKDRPVFEFLLLTEKEAKEYLLYSVEEPELQGVLEEQVAVGEEVNEIEERPDDRDSDDSDSSDSDEAGGSEESDDSGITTLSEDSMSSTESGESFSSTSSSSSSSSSDSNFDEPSDEFDILEENED